MLVEQVASSHIKAVAWDRDERTLYIQFHTGDTYVWDGVPRRVFKEMVEAPSKGRFLHEVIRTEYGDGAKM
jgi:hypothetical protein